MNDEPVLHPQQISGMSNTTKFKVIVVKFMTTYKIKTVYGNFSDSSYSKIGIFGHKKIRTNSLSLLTAITSYFNG